MDHRVRPHGGEEVEDRLAVADIDCLALVGWSCLLEPAQVLGRVAAGAEEVGAHVVVHADHPPSHAAEILGRLTPNETRRPRDYDAFGLRAHQRVLPCSEQ